MARPALAGLIALWPLLLGAQQPSPQLKQAGVCSRCHVAQVLEWSAAARHTQAGTACQSCHGASAAHVANERNQVKPDRLPRNAAEFAALCATCHTAGCPKTAKKADCQSCHHPHALANPNERAMRPPSGVPANSQEYRARMAAGEQAVARAEWPAARDAFAAALKTRPGDRRAAARLRMAERRLHPAAMPGLEIVGNEFDAESGLPRRVRVAGLGLEMLLAPGGETELGAEAWRDAQPVHSVYVEPFYLGLHEVTQREWTALGLENPSAAKGDALPVHGVSWNESREWVARLNARTPGAAFRLPSEAEWERAARLNATADLNAVAWHRANSAVVAGAAGFKESSAYAPRAVGQKRAGAAGFFDLQGNVAEWCASLLRPYPYEARDGRESADGDGLRAVRGGAFADSPEYLDPAFRHSERPARRSPWTGLRLAR
ncbi:MAG: SUMF1/EgtB/PvdO family nonheme iron enzyme [Bryobacterales bacterium]|nr:SUMF1/EgtB/PvdO family nonheme iron enzyme [Bryobacterales bacterium]